MNKKIILIAAVVLLLFAIVSSGCVQEKENVYTIGVNAALEPFSAKSIVTGEPYGIDVDLINLIADKQGFDVKYVFISTAEFMDALDEGSIDVVTGKVINEERLKRCDFSDVYYTTKYGLIVRKDSGITIDDVLSGKASVAVHSGSAYETWLKNYHGVEKYNKLVNEGKIITKTSVNAVIYSVLVKEADSGISNEGSISEQLAEYAPLKFAGYVAEDKDAGFAVKKGNSELVSLLNKGLDQIKASGEYDDIMDAYEIPIVKSEYIIGVDENNPPWTYLDKNGEFTGFDVDSLNWIAEQEGFKLTFVNIPWSKNVNAIIVGDIDLFASGMSMTEDRIERLGFSDPYVSMGTVVMGKSSSASKSGFESGNIVTGIIYGTSDVNFLNELLGSDKYNQMLLNGKIRLYDSQNSLENGISAGEIDALITSEASISYFKDKLGLHTVATYKNADDFGYAMRNGDIELQNVINNGIESLSSSGKRAELMAKYGIN